MKITFLVIFFFLTITSVIGQKEANIWYFGNQAGLDFSSGSPVAITNSAMSAGEGCAVICDKNTGGLLFYTDGMTVYNKNHLIMPTGTGLHGSNNSTQTALIVPFPGSDSLYYIFTISDFQNNEGFKYSVVDMSQNGGLGDVTTKNTMLLADASEKLAGVYHCNKIDVWVLVHQSNSMAYYAYLVTAGGISAPVITNIGSVFPGNGFPGYLKFSPDGFKVAVVGNVQMSQLHLLDFDNSTGVLSNFRLIDTNIAGYGVSFSPDNTKLYVGSFITQNIYQYDVSLGTAVAIAMSKKFIGNAGAPKLCTVQLGPDGRLYIAKRGAGNIDVIKMPNQLGATCNYAINAVNLAGMTSVNGLPNYIESYFDTSNPSSCGVLSVSVTSTNVICNKQCNGTSTATPIGGGNPYTYLWNPGGQSTSTATGLCAGNYTVTVTDGTSAAVTAAVTITQPSALTATVVSTSSACGGNNGTANIIAGGGRPSYTYSWNPGGQTTSAITGLIEGSYTVTVIDAKGCDTTHIVTVVASGSITATATNSTICANQSVTLTASGGANYSWNTGATTSSLTLTLTSASTFTVIVSSGSCSDTATATVTVTSSVTTNQSASICQGFTYTLPGGTVVSANGTYIDTLVSTAGCDSIITTTLTVNTNPTANAFSNTTITQGQSTTLTATGGGTYQWSPAAGLNCVTCVNPVVTAFPLLGTGRIIYCVTVTDANNCTDTACVTITIIEPIDCFSAGELYLPNAFSPNNDGENDRLQIYYGNPKCIKTFKLVIYNRWGEKVFETTNPVAEWDGAFDRKRMSAAVFVYYMEVAFTNGEKIAKKGSISLMQ